MQQGKGKNHGKTRAGVNPDSSLFDELSSGILRLKSLGVAEGHVGHFLSSVRHVLQGMPLRSVDEDGERLSKLKALPILASDNISSSAYATEQIARVLAPAGLAALTLTLPITLVLIGVLCIVVLSYTQVVKAYPEGGGSYNAARQNLGIYPGLVVAACLLIDYTLTIAVSVTAGLEALTSIMPWLYPYRITIDLAIIAGLMVMNLRGLRESGTLFSIPTYCYLFSILGLLGFGLFRLFTGTLPTVALPSIAVTSSLGAVGFLLVMRAFASGAVALTGVEAVADGVRALKAPEGRNAQIILFWMAAIFACLFFTISFLTSRMGLVPDPTEQETLISQLARMLIGSGPIHLVLQISTAMILLLAANTALVGFPRLTAVLAKDRFFPNQFLRRGDRLALSTGVIAVSSVACVFVLLFKGSVAALIPLYTIGVFIAFSLSQAGMVRHWWKERGKSWGTSAVINGVGMVVTAVVALEASAIKFSHGAWVILVLAPILVAGMHGIHRHYQLLGKQLKLDPMETRLPPPTKGLTLSKLVLVPVGDLTRATAEALAYARSIGPEVRAVHVTEDADSAERFRKRWELWAKDVPLVIIEVPYRNWTSALILYLESLGPDSYGTYLTVVIAEFIPRHWWEHMLHSQAALRLKLALLSKPHIVVIDVPYQLPV